MTNDEVRKLLGGYATNTLTEAERKTLFDAALDDQELFNALQDEEALKDLLSDPVSRAQLQRALEEPATKRVAWWNRRWAWTGAAAAAAAVIIVGVVRMNPSREMARVQQSPAVSLDASKQVDSAESKPAPPNPAPKTKNARAETDTAPAEPRRLRAPAGAVAEKKEATTTDGAPTAAPPPPPAVTAPPPTPAPAQQNAVASGPSQNQQNQNATQPFQTFAEQRQFRDSLGARATVQNSLLRYSVVVRRDNGAYSPATQNEALNEGDEVRLNVVSISPGLLSLDRIDASGAVVRLFPANGPGLAVTPNTNYTIPIEPIAVKDRDQQYRLTLTPQIAPIDVKSASGITGGLARSSKAKVEGNAGLKKDAPATSVDITIGPRR